VRRVAIGATARTARPLADLRNEYKDAFFKKHGVKLGFMSAFVKASAVALMEIPQVCAGSLGRRQR